jgi:hypothetical protein
MRTATFAAFMVFLSVAASAHAQQSQTENPAKAQAITSTLGIDDAAFAGSARASKLIGSKVYAGDTSIGQIEDVLVSLDHATVRSGAAPGLSFAGRFEARRHGQPGLEASRSAEQ